MRAIDRFARGDRSRASVGAFMREHTFPIVEGSTITFVWHGEADEVKLRHWVFGLPSSQPLERVEGTNLWFIAISLPPASRMEYKFEVTRRGNNDWVQDPLNPRLARDPFGANSVAHGEGYDVPDWVRTLPGVPKGRYEEIEIDSAELGRRKARVYLPHRYRTTRRYPLLVVHDGDDYLRYASMGAILDNLMARREIPDLVVVFTTSSDRLVEYAGDERHARFVTEELVPRVESTWGAGGQPQLRCIMGASFGGVASLSTAWRYPGFYGRLLLQSGSFAFTDIGDRNHRGPLFDPVVKFMNAYRESPQAISERVFVSCGTYESLIYENRSLVPVLENTGMNVRFCEARDGHNWENWRDRLREGLSWLFPGPFLLIYD